MRPKIEEMNEIGEALNIDVRTFIANQSLAENKHVAIRTWQWLKTWLYTFFGAQWYFYGPVKHVVSSICVKAPKSQSQAVDTTDFYYGCS